MMDWTGSQAASGTVGALVRARAEAQGDGIFALFSSEPPLTWRDLDRRSDALAARLEGQGIGCGARVALLSGAGPLQLLALVACWKLGVLLSPVDRFINPQAFATLLAQFDPQTVLFGPGVAEVDTLADIVDRGGRPVIHLAGLDLGAGSPSPREIQADAPALALYTSGSTGVPKGVLHSQASLLHGARFQSQAQQVGPCDRVLCVLPLSHMNGLVTTFLSPLLTGGSVVYLQEEFNPATVLRLIDLHGCTWFSAVPTHYTLLVSPPVPLEPGSLKTLRFCRSASAPLPGRILETFEAHYGVPIIETMGTTESAGQIFANPMPPLRHKANAVGLPFGLDVRLVDQAGRACAPGEAGEMQVRGPAMMLGYLDDAAETAKAFDGPWFKTGDIAAVDEDGYWFIKGRIKDIAVFCGINVSLRQIETDIHRGGWVLDVACVGVPHPIFGEVVTIYAIPRSADDDLEAMGRHLTKAAVPNLPSPQALLDVRFVDRFPRSGAGKVLKGRLAEIPELFRLGRTVSMDPRRMLADLFDMPVEDIADDLAMGMIPRWDSLGYVSLIAMVETALDRHLEAAEIVALTSLKGLTAVLEGKPVASDGPPPAVGHRDAASQAVRDCVSRLVDAGYGSTSVTYAIVGYEFCREQGVVSPEALIDGLLDALPSDRNLVMNTFTWRFCRGEPYDSRRTACEVGLVNELFRRRPDVVRSHHPIYSYAVLGPDRDELAAHPGPTCWGEGSVTLRLLEREDVTVVTYGLPPLPGHGDSLLRANPTIHALEQMFRVPYRYFKTFTGLADFTGAPQPYATSMYVRYLDRPVDNSWLPIYRLMLSRGLGHACPEERLFVYDNAAVREIGRELLDENPLALFVERYIK